MVLWNVEVERSPGIVLPWVVLLEPEAGALAGMELPELELDWAAIKPTESDSTTAKASANRRTDIRNHAKISQKPFKPS
jgi:hypothetical protein